MKTTAFHKYHVAAGAKMAEFAGYDMPIEFTGINDEHMTVRQGAGVFDVSHMGEIWVKGPRAYDLLQHITTNDVARLYPGKVQYSCMPNGRGGIVDDILVYKFSDEKYMLCVNAANIDKDWAHICREGEAFGMRPGVELENASDNICQLAVDTCFWPLFEVIDGEWIVNYEPKKKLPIEDFLRPQGRFKHLFKPGKEHLIADIQAEVDRRWDELLKRAK